MKIFFILIILFYFSCSPKKIKFSDSYDNAFESYLFLQRLSSDSLKIEHVMRTYLDSLKLDSKIFKRYVLEFNSDLKFRQSVLQKLVTKQDSTRLDSNLNNLFQALRSKFKADSINEMRLNK